MESGRFDSVHPAPYFIADIYYGLSYGSDHTPVSTALYPRRLDKRLVGLA